MSTKLLVALHPGFIDTPAVERAYALASALNIEIMLYSVVYDEYIPNLNIKEDEVQKITEEDWRNREKWDDYKAAINDMVSHTSTEYAPWTLIPGNDKKYARVEILRDCN